ncbi:MAG: 3-phosphoglycerate dehydrogenase [Gammaproteobacteria bacterium]|nr:3-phosphoglycerate dehydrogenase [Gammaproteobacteria bacterium]
MSQKVKIVVPGDDPAQIADSPALDRLREYGEVTVYRERPADDAEKLARVEGAEVILNTRSMVTWREAQLRQLPQLRLIATCSVGTDSIDLVTAKELGVTVANQPGGNAPFVAEHMFGLMFAVAKQAGVQTAALRAGEWLLPQNVMLQGKVLGIVGTGAIGAEMARLGRAIGMDVIAWTFNPSAERAQQLGVRFVSLDELLVQADVVSLHVSLTDETRGLIGAEQLSAMKSNAILLNGARGDVVDNLALAECLNAGGLYGAGLDVFAQEPISPTDPLLQCERVVLTPHAADQTPEAVVAINNGAVDNIIAFLEGKPHPNAAA